MAGAFLQKSRRGTVYYFRRKVRHDLRGVFGRPRAWGRDGDVAANGTRWSRPGNVRTQALVSLASALPHLLANARRQGQFFPSDTTALFNESEGYRGPAWPAPAGRTFIGRIKSTMYRL